MRLSVCVIVSMLARTYIHACVREKGRKKGWGNPHIGIHVCTTVCVGVSVCMYTRVLFYISLDQFVGTLCFFFFSLTPSLFSPAPSPINPPLHPYTELPVWVRTGKAHGRLLANVAPPAHRGDGKVWSCYTFAHMETRCAALSITVTVCLRGCFTFEHYPSVFMESMPLTPVSMLNGDLLAFFWQ